MFVPVDSRPQQDFSNDVTTTENYLIWIRNKNAVIVNDIEKLKPTKGRDFLVDG
jgi:hypothetical protein